MPVIILPAKNEETTIASTIAAIKTVYKGAEIIVVDGWSTDNTKNIARWECRVPVLIDDGRGKGSGLRTAFEWVKATCHQYDGNVIFVDPDGSYPLYQLPEFIEALKHNDVVIGERTHFVAGSLPIAFKIGDWLSRLLFRIIYGEKLDNLSGFRGLSRSAIEKMDLQEDGFGIETEITAKAVRAGLSIKSIPINYYPREGESKFRPVKDTLVVLKAMWRYREWKPR
jgi:dolichol-phosphate mannosyltransferase